MSNKYNKKMGDWGEALAAQFLVKKGYEVVEKNYQTKYGEIDLICRNKTDLVFVEVKTRTNKKFGIAEDAVSYLKCKKIKLTIEQYLFTHEVVHEPRFDVVVVEVFSLKPNFIHYESVDLP